MKYATRINSFFREGKDLWQTMQAIAQVDGIDYVDLNYPEHFKDYAIDEIKTMMDKTGLKLNAVNLRFREEYIAGIFDHADAQIRKKAVQLSLSAADACRKLGGRQCIIWLGYDGFDYSFQKNYVAAWDHLVSCFREVCQGVDCRVSVEYKPYEERTFALIDSWGTAWKLMKDVDCKNFGITLDFCHMLMKKENPAFAAAILLRENKLFGIHVNDGEGNFDDGLIVGSVHPWKTLELFYYLSEGNYQDVIYFDTFPKRESAEEECRINRKICGIYEDKLRGESLQLFKKTIEKGDGIAAVELMASTLQ